MEGRCFLQTALGNKLPRCRDLFCGRSVEIRGKQASSSQQTTPLTTLMVFLHGIIEACNPLPPGLRWVKVKCENKLADWIWTHQMKRNKASSTKVPAQMMFPQTRVTVMVCALTNHSHIILCHYTESVLVKAHTVLPLPRFLCWIIVIVLVRGTVCLLA